MLLYLLPVADKLLLTKTIGLRILLSDASSLGQFVLSLVCSRQAPSASLDASVSNYSVFVLS